MICLNFQIGGSEDAEGYCWKQRPDWEQLFWEICEHEIIQSIFAFHYRNKLDEASHNSGIRFVDFTLV